MQNTQLEPPDNAISTTPTVAQCDFHTPRTASVKMDSITRGCYSSHNSYCLYNKGVCPNIMQTIHIRIQGIVQKVGLRMKIKQIANEMGISGTVENMNDGSVLIVCEAEQVSIDALMRRIRGVAEPATIDEMRVERTSPATGISGFTVIVGDMQQEMLAALSTGSKAVAIISNTLNNMKNTQNEIRDTQKEMQNTQNEIRDTVVSIGDKMDMSLKKEDQTLKILKDMRGSGLLHAVK